VSIRVQGNHRSRVATATLVGWRRVRNPDLSLGAGGRLAAEEAT